MVKIQRFNMNSPEWVRKKMASPEMTAKRLEARRKFIEAGGRVGRMMGQQNGVRKRVYIKRLEKAKVFAEKAIRLMSDNNIWKADNDKAELAMKTAIEIMQAQQGQTQHRLSAAKTILEFTQTKPVVKNETTLKSAEDFLAALAVEEGNATKP